MDLKQGPAVRIFRWGLARLRLVSITCFPSQTSGLTLRSPHSQLSEQSLAALLAKSGVHATLRLLFARQAKGKRKLVLGGFFNSNPTFAPSAGTSNLVQSPTVTQMEMFCSFDDWFCQAIARLLDRCGQFQN